MLHATMSAPIHVVCLACHIGQEQQTKKTFLGFPSFLCEACGAKSELPLSTGYVVIYALSFLLSVYGALATGHSGGCFLVLGVAAIPALLLHVRAKRTQAVALANEK